VDSFDGIFEFVAVAQTGGFSAAAKQLNCSTSHISRQVSRLEKRLGSRLFARTTRQIKLTENGEFYFLQCQQLITGLQHANEQVSNQTYMLNGTLRVSAAGGFAESHIAPALMAFAKLHPELKVDINFNSQIVNFVEDRIDFAVRYGELNDSNLIARKLISRTMMLVASPDYLNAFGTPTHPSQLKDHRCIITNSDQWGFNINGAKRTIKITGHWRSNNTNVVLKACEQGLGIAYMPESTFTQSVKQNKLTAILTPYCLTDATSWIVYQNKQFMPLRARLAIDFLLQYFANWDET
jgi:DNA-binding transcriptional LysR family regulator